MLGHGSPVSRWSRRNAFSLRTHWLLINRSLLLFLCFHLWAISGFVSWSVAQDSSFPSRPSFEEEIAPTKASRQVGVRVSWGGGEEVQWQGAIRYSGGTIFDIRALGLTPDTPGSVYLKNGAVNIEQRSPTEYGGVELFVDYQPGGELHTFFRDPKNPDKVIQRVIPLDDILEKTVSEELDSLRNRLTVARAPGDWLRLDMGREHLVLETGKTLSVSVLPNFTGLKSQRVRCRASLLPARSTGSPMWSEDLEFELDEFGNSTAQTLDVPVPPREGVYDLRLELEPRSLSQRLGQQRPLTRSLQFVALAPHAPAGSRELWREQLVIDPASNPSLIDQWSQLLRQAGLRNGAQYSKRTVVDHAGERLVQLEPGGWQAIGMRVSQSEQPVLVEIEYVADEGAAIGVSVIQPDASGAMPAYGFDSGVIVSDSFSIEGSEESKLHRHQVIFWPQAKQPFLLIANRSQTTAVKFGKIRVLTGPDRLAADRHLPDSGLKDRTRQFLAFYESPMFPENFGAQEVYEAAIDQTIDDWVTFYQGADRLIQYLKANGYTGTMLTVAADSGAIYPSVHLGATPIFDSGVFFSSGQDPTQKDVLELLFQMFDREGLTLIPALALSGPIPELEDRIRVEGAANYRPVDFRGATTTDPSRPTYNPLNQEVQAKVEEIVGELTQRYTDHPAFGGVSLLCRPDTYTQLSGRRWGYDSPTVTQFLNDSGGIQLVSGIESDWSQLQNLLLGANQKQWLAWRAVQMSNWYQRIQETVADGKKGRRLYLSAVDIYRHPDVVSSLCPSLHWSSQFEEAMLELGWDAAELKNHPSIVLLKPNRIDGNSSIGAKKVEVQTEQSQKTLEFFRQQTIAGELFTHRAQWAHFSELQGQSPFSGGVQPMLRLQQLAPSGWQNRKRYIESIRNLDARLLVDGGWLLTMGQEKSLMDLVDVYTRLPDLPFAEVASTKRADQVAPVVIRQALTDGRWYFYAINDSPWTTEARLVLNRGDVNKVESLSLDDIQIKEGDGARYIQVQLKPYSIVGGFCEDASTQIIDFDYSVSEEVVAKLKTRLNQLQLRLIQATDVRPMNVIANADFESPGVPVTDWMYDRDRQSEFFIDAVSSDNSALQMTSQKGPNWIRSNSFEVPQTGRLSISVWMKKDAAHQQPPLRIAIESENSDYYRYGSTGSLAPDDPSNQIGNDWRQYVVHFDDLPVDLDTRLRVGFDMMGAGQVWIDRIEVYDRLFDGNDIQALTQRLAAARRLVVTQNDYDLCRRMLNGYWLRFLNDYIGGGQPPQRQASGRGEILVDQAPAARTSSIFDRFRKMVRPRLNRR